MELYIYDSDKTLLGIIDEIASLVWTRRYWACGEFSLLVPMTEKHASLLKLGRIILRRDCDEAGQIRYRHITKDADGLESIELQGMFLTHWIGKRLIIPMINVEAGTHELLARIVNDNLVAPADPRRMVPNLVIDLSGVSSEPYAYTSEEFANAFDVCEARAQVAKLGFKITTDPRTKQHIFKVYKGVDRTSGQTVNPMCVFSPDFDNVLEQEFAESDENIATAIYLQSDSTLSTEARAPVEVYDDSKVGLDRVEFFYSASDVSSGGEENVDYVALLTAKGNSVLSDKVESISFSSKINPSSHLKYKVDYDVGDHVTCLNRRWGVKIDARITEAQEAYESGKAEVTITFGTSLPTLSDKLKWR